MENHCWAAFLSTTLISHSALQAVCRLIDKRRLSSLSSDLLPVPGPEWKWKSYSMAMTTWGAGSDIVSQICPSKEGSSYHLLAENWPSCPETCLCSNRAKTQVVLGGQWETAVMEKKYKYHLLSKLRASSQLLPLNMQVYKCLVVARYLQNVAWERLSSICLISYLPGFLLQPKCIVLSIWRGKNL